MTQQPLRWRYQLAWTRSRPWEHRLRQVGADLTAVLRSLMVGTTVFTLAVLTGALLSGATPARPVPTSEVTATEPAVPAGQHAAVVGADQAFAYSMIYSGAVALALSIAGMALVLRRRRLW